MRSGAALASIDAGSEYYTPFNTTENPLSEGGIWIPSGANWAKVKSASGYAIGLQTGLGTYDDAHAVLDGPWGPDMRIKATVHRDAGLNLANSHELWLGLRWGTDSSTARGYECNVSAGNAAFGSYAEIVIWNGAVGDFNYVSAQGAAGPGVVADGDIFEAQIVGNVITTFFTPVATGVRATLNTVNITTPNGGGPGTIHAPWTSGRGAIGVYRGGNTGAFDGDFAWADCRVIAL